MRRWLLRRARGPVALVALAGACLGLAPAAAQDGPQLDFPDARPRSLTFAQAQEGVPIRLCNTGGGPANALSAEPTGFGFKQSKEAAAEEAVLEPLTKETSLAAGDCIELDVRLRPRQTLDDGSYAGVVAVRARGAALARIEVTIAGQPPEIVPAKPAGALETAPLQGRRGRWFLSSFDLDDGGRLPLRAPNEARESLELPTQGVFLGNLFNGTRMARVYVGEGEVQKETGVWYLPLRIEGADEAGTWTGKLDVAQSEVPGEAIAVTLEVKDKWWCAVLAILLGSLLSLLTQLALGRWRPQIGLWYHRWRLQKKYDEAKGKFADREPELTGFDRPSRTKVETYRKAVAANQKQYRKSVIFYDTTADGYKVVEKALRQAEDDVEALGAEDGLHGSLVALVAALEDLAKFLQKDLRTPHQPRLVRTAGALLKGKDLEVGEATTRAKKADDFVTFIAEWKAIAERARRYEVWARQLAAEHFSGSDTRMSDPDFRILDRAFLHIVEAKRELFAARDRSELEATGPVANLGSARDRLAFLGARYGVWEPDPDVKLGDAGEVDFDLFPATRAVKANLIMTTVSEAPFNSWVGALADLLVTPATAGVVIKTLRWFLDLFIVLVAILVGIVAGLGTLYFDKSFGTAEDYLTAILVGAASQVLTKGVLDALTQIRKQDAGLAEKPPAPARAEAAS